MDQQGLLFQVEELQQLPKWHQQQLGRVEKRKRLTSVAKIRRECLWCRREIKKLRKLLRQQGAWFEVWARKTRDMIERETRLVEEPELWRMEEP